VLCVPEFRSRLESSVCGRLKAEAADGKIFFNN
jgi:hypothetical protein